MKYTESEAMSILWDYGLGHHVMVQGGVDVDTVVTAMGYECHMPGKARQGARINATRGTYCFIDLHGRDYDSGETVGELVVKLIEHGSASDETKSILDVNRVVQ